MVLHYIVTSSFLCPCHCLKTGSIFIEIFCYYLGGGGGGGEGGISIFKQHIAHVTRNVSSCPNSTKYDRLRIQKYLNEGKLKKTAKRTHDETLRS
uniref:Uncharacterized protein n=1 Tax=Lactuca sativa TaxID=4236 RepID=A0A9R1W8S4_LACSA|nr:hypothetical protein LSAT_V11C300109350 [Lactuca sativa]